MKLIKKYEQILPITFQRASILTRENVNKNNELTFSVESLQSDSVRKECFYKPISKIIPFK